MALLKCEKLGVPNSQATNIKLLRLWKHRVVRKSLGSDTVSVQVRLPAPPPRANVGGKWMCG